VNVPLLIGAMVRQTMVLIAQLATTGGVRAPLAQVADQVFKDLVNELERQGVSRKVSADMFGMGLRTYLRRIQRLGESSTERGRTLWEALLDFLGQSGVVTKGQVFERFYRDDENLVRGVLHDLVESGLIFCSGTGSDVAYRAATSEEIGQLRRVRSGEGLDELIWAIVYREGPISKEGILELGGITEAELDRVLARLENTGRIDAKQSSMKRVYTASTFLVGLGEDVGFEAAVFDHFQAVVKTICRRLRRDPTELPLPEGMTNWDVTGGSTYTFDIWDGHPMTEQVLKILSQYRNSMSELREAVEAFNAQHGIPKKSVKVLSYAGQSLMTQDDEVIA
jgi:hypothetical protein